MPHNQMPMPPKGGGGGGGGQFSLQDALSKDYAAAGSAPPEMGGEEMPPGDMEGGGDPVVQEMASKFGLDPGQAQEIYDFVMQSVGGGTDMGMDDEALPEESEEEKNAEIV